MSEPTREEMLEELDCILAALGIKETEVMRAIRKLVEARPRVTEEFIEKWVKELWHRNGYWARGELRSFIKDMFQEAGVEVTASEKEGE